MYSLLQQVSTWPDIEADPLPIGSADLLSLRIAKEAATDESGVFITKREFGRVLFGASTIYLTLPLTYAHWAIIRGWAEPHFYASFGLMPPGVMILYTSRDEHELSICRSLFWVSYNSSLNEEKELGSVGWALDGS